jgi:restriction system protein
MKRYYRVMLGKKSVHASECFADGFIGAGLGGINRDISDNLPDDLRTFNQQFIPEMQKLYTDKSKISLGLSCGFGWTICKGIRVGDIVLCPDGKGSYLVGETTGGYYYVEGGVLPHRRPVRWFSQSLGRSDMSEALRYSTGSLGTVSEISKYADELEKLIGGAASPERIGPDETVEDPASFALEKHLEDFLVQNWANTDLGKQYDIYEEEGEQVGQQYLTDTGPVDILAVSKDKQTLLVVEVKKGRASDVVVGQTLRYMGYVRDELAEDSQDVRGVIIALEDDQRIRRALTMTPSIEFYRYQISFRLEKG